jgi:hypothetical protein
MYQDNMNNSSISCQIFCKRIERKLELVVEKLDTDFPNLFVLPITFRSSTHARRSSVWEENQTGEIVRYEGQ